MGSKVDDMELKRTEKQQRLAEREVMARNMEGIRGVLAELMPGALTDDMSPDELRRLLSSRLSISSSNQSHSGVSVVSASGVDPNVQLLPPIAERDADSTAKALRAVAGVLGQTGKVVTAALKQAKSRNDKLLELVLGSEQLLHREVETSDDAISKIQSYFKDLHEALTTREEEIIKEFNGIRIKEKQRVEERLTDLRAEEKHLSEACRAVETLLDGSSSSSLGKLDSFNSPIEALLEAMDSAAKVLEHEGRGVSKNGENAITGGSGATTTTTAGIKPDSLDSLTFHLCNDSSLYRQIESLQMVSFEQPHRDARGRVVGKGSKVVLMGTPEAVAQEAREQALGTTTGGGVADDAASAYASHTVGGVGGGGRWDLLDDGDDSIDGAGEGFSSSSAQRRSFGDGGGGGGVVAGGRQLKVVTVIPFNPSQDPEEEPKGLVHWLGSHGLQDEFRNPALLTSSDPFLLVLRASSRIEGELASLTSRSHLRGTFFETDSALSSWVAVELPDGMFMRPDHYTLSYYIDGSEHIPRNWVLQGSADGVRWTTLRVHENEISLENPPHVSTWPLGNRTTSSPSSAGAGSSINGGGEGGAGLTAYRSFRITQTGPTSSGTLFLLLSGLELYGTLFSTSGKVVA